MNLFYAFLISAIIAGLALWRNLLSLSGSLGAIIIGTLVFGFGGLYWGLVLGVFFISSSLLSQFKKEQKKTAAEKFAKGSRRDFAQVMANGSLGALLATLYGFVPWPGWFYLFVGVMASVNADTWATELGTLNPQPPRLITTGRFVQPGISGGVSPLGIGASLLGGVLIGLAAGLLFHELQWWAGLLMGGLGGLVGSLCDSLLGATVQQMYFCENCQLDTERRLHKCGHPTQPLRGWSWMNNDAVNLLASMCGGLVSLGLWFWM